MTNRAIETVIDKAVKRAEWYERNYKGAKDFLKRKKKQFWNVIAKWERKHDLTIEQERYLFSLIPEEFRDIYCALKNDKKGAVK